MGELNLDFWVYMVGNVRKSDPVKFGLRLLGGELVAQDIAGQDVPDGTSRDAN